MEKMKFDPGTYTATCFGFTYTLGSAAIAAEMKLVDLDKNRIGKVTYSPDVLDLITACIMAECLYGVPAVSGDEPGTLILHPVWDQESLTSADKAGERFGRYVPGKESPDWKLENEVPYVTSYQSMALRAVGALTTIEDSPIGSPQFKIQSKTIHWATEFKPESMLGIEVKFLVHLTMESKQKFTLVLQDRSVLIHPTIGHGNVYYHNTTLETHGTAPLDEDTLALQIFGVLNTYTGLTYEKVQEFFDQKMDWTEIEDGLPNECQNVKFVQAHYNDATELYEFTTGNGLYKDGRFWDPSTSQPVEATKWKPRKY